MIDGSENRNRQLAFELQNSHVCEKRSNVPQSMLHVQNFCFLMFSFPSPSPLLLLPCMRRECDSCAQCLYLVLWSAVQYTRYMISMIRRVRYLVTLLLFGFCSSEMY